MNKRTLKKALLKNSKGVLVTKSGELFKLALVEGTTVHKNGISLHEEIFLEGVGGWHTVCSFLRWREIKGVR